MKTVINKENSVKQSNNLVISKYTFTVLEQRILYAVCSQMPRNTDDFVSVRMSVSELANFCGITSANKYTAIKQISNKLMRRIVTIPTSDGGEYTSHWLQSRRYYPDDSTIEFKLDSDLKKEFLNLRKAYLDIPATTLMSFKKAYSARMYLILKRILESSKQNKYEFEYKLSFFREKFELGKTYDKISNLKNGVLKPALDEINEKSDIHVDYEYIKSGKICSKIKFIVSMKEIAEKNNQKAISTLRPEKVMTDVEQKMYERLINVKWDIQSDVAKELIKKYDLTRIEENLKYVDKKRATLLNPGGILIDSIEIDRAGDQRKREADTKAANEREKKQNEEKYKLFLKEQECSDKIQDSAETNDNPEKQQDLKKQFAALKVKLKQK